MKEEEVDNMVCGSLLRPDVPWVLLVRSNEFYTTGMYLERALQKIANLVTIYVERYKLFGRIFPKTFARLVEMLASRRDGFLLTNFGLATVPSTLDAILVVDPVRKIFDFSKFNAPTAFYAIDSHRSFDKHIKDAKAQDYDFVFVAQKDDIWKYKETGCERVYWLPLACDPEIHKRYKLPMEHDICFVGRISPKTERWLIIQKLKKEFSTFAGHRYLHDMARVYSQSRIVLNKSIGGDLNMRVFEAMSCGRLLLTDRIANGLEELFVDGKCLVVYDSLDDLTEKIRYYLAREDEREEIAARGQREAQRKHTYLHRAKFILDVVLLESIR